MLRIIESAEDIEDIGISLRYMRDFLRITVTDLGDDNCNKQNEQQKIALAILLKLVDDYDMSRLDDGQYQVMIDFTYDKDLDITGFLMQHERIE